MLEMTIQINSVIRSKLLRKWTFENSKSRKLKSQKFIFYARRISIDQQERTDIDRRGYQTREVLTKASPSVRVPRAETRLTVYRSPLVRMLPQLVGLFPVERACMKLDVFFQVLVKFVKQMCLWICIFQILIILRLRPELVNDQNDRTETKFYPEEICQKVKKWRLNYWVFFFFFRKYRLKNKMSSQAIEYRNKTAQTSKWDVTKQDKSWRKQVLLYVSPELKPGWRFTARFS